MSMSHLGSTRDAENDVSDGVGLSHESPCAAVDQEQQYDVDPKHHHHHHDDDVAKNKIFVARNGSMGVPNGKKGALSAKDLRLLEHSHMISSACRHGLVHIAACVYCHRWSIHSCVTSNICLAGLGCWAYFDVGVFWYLNAIISNACMLL